jgi:hypothetical protein
MLFRVEFESTAQKPIYIFMTLPPTSESFNQSTWRCGRDSNRIYNLKCNLALFVDDLLVIILFNHFLSAVELVYRRTSTNYEETSWYISLLYMEKKNYVYENAVLSDRL